MSYRARQRSRRRWQAIKEERETQERTMNEMTKWEKFDTKLLQVETIVDRANNHQHRLMTPGDTAFLLDTLPQIIAGARELMGMPYVSGVWR